MRVFKKSAGTPDCDIMRFVKCGRNGCGRRKLSCGRISLSNTGDGGRMLSLRFGGTDVSQMVFASELRQYVADWLMNRGFVIEKPYRREDMKKR